MKLKLKGLKKRKKKKPAKNAATGGAVQNDGDVEMEPGPAVTSGDDRAGAVMDAEGEDGADGDPSSRGGGRAAHHAKVEAKRALRVKVAEMKRNRSKLTKLPGDKQARKQLTAAIKDMVLELGEHAGRKQKTKKKAKGRS